MEVKLEHRYRGGLLRKFVWCLHVPVGTSLRSINRSRLYKRFGIRDGARYMIYINRVNIHCGLQRLLDIGLN